MVVCFLPLTAGTVRVENTGPSSAQWELRGALFGRQVAFGNVSYLKEGGGGGVGNPSVTVSLHSGRGV